jgi:hypothetical protein
MASPIDLKFLSYEQTSPNRTGPTLPAVEVVWICRDYPLIINRTNYHLPLAVMMGKRTIFAWVCSIIHIGVE